MFVVWAVRRGIRPGKLALRRSPARPNRLGAVHVLCCLLGWLVAMSLAGDLARRAAAQLADPAAGPAWTTRLLVLLRAAITAGWLAALLAVARATFRGGVRRGLGLSGRRWLYDSLRGVVGYLAVLPVCVGLNLLMISLFARWGLQPHFHPVLLEFSSLPPAWKAATVATTVLLVPLAEEVYFRGLLQSAVRRWTGSAWGGILAASLLFAALHTQQPQALPSLFALSVAMGYNYERTGRLWAPVLIHALFNGVNLATWSPP